VSSSPIRLAELNVLSRDEFTARIGPVYEHSPWIAEETWTRRPFISVEKLHAELDATLRATAPEKQLALIRTHPNLAGRLARAGQLTSDSTAEQRSAGLDRLTADEAAEFDRLNRAYTSRFGFPFVICARLNDRSAMLETFRRRLAHSPEAEIETALVEIHKIAGLRLAQIVHD